MWSCGFVALVLTSARPRASLGLARPVCGPQVARTRLEWSAGRTCTAPVVRLLCAHDSIITRAIYHKSLGDVPSMLMEIGGHVPKWSPTPVPPPPWPGLTFPDFRDFSDFFARRPCPLVSFELKLCVIVGHR